MVFPTSDSFTNVTKMFPKMFDNGDDNAFNLQFH